jgi:hypothetical protein
MLTLLNGFLQKVRVTVGRMTSIQIRPAARNWLHTCSFFQEWMENKNTILYLCPPSDVTRMENSISCNLSIQVNIRICRCVGVLRTETEALRMIVDASWLMPNTVIRRDLQIWTVKEEIRRYSSQYSARLSEHPNGLTVNLIELPDNRRLRRHQPNDLPIRFLV